MSAGNAAATLVSVAAWQDSQKKAKPGMGITDLVIIVLLGGVVVAGASWMMRSPEPADKGVKAKYKGKASDSQWGDGRAGSGA